MYKPTDGTEEPGPTYSRRQYQERLLEKGYLFKSLKGEHMFARQTRELPGRGDCGKGTGQQDECAWWGMAWGPRSRGANQGERRSAEVSHGRLWVLE